MRRPSPAQRAFTLVELMLAITIGLALCGVVVQSLLASSRVSGLAARRHQAKAAQRRTLELIRSEALQAVAIRTAPAAASDCAASGRAVLLELETEAGRISYSVGGEPSAIWRPQVLMRCGPAYGIRGDLSTGQVQNRVVLDRLIPAHGFQIRRPSSGRMELRLTQSIASDSTATVSTQRWLADHSPSMEDVASLSPNEPPGRGR